MQRLFFLPFFRIFKLVIYKCKKRKQKTHLYKYNSFVGVGKHVMNDSENSPTLKTKENTCRFLRFMFSLLRVFKNKLVCEFSKHQNAVFLFKYIMNRNPVLVHKNITTNIKKKTPQMMQRLFLKKKFPHIIPDLSLCYNTIFVNTVTSKINFFIPKKTCATGI